MTLHVGWLEHFPDKMRKFDRAVYDGIILDDIRDLKLLHLHQEMVQGKYDDVIEFASTPGGQCAFERWLSKVPPVATVNYSTSNLDMLETDDFLSCPKNRVVVEYPPS